MKKIKNLQFNDKNSHLSEGCLQEGTMRFLLFLSLTISLSVAIHDFVLEGAKNNFTGFKVYRVIPTTDEQLEFLQRMEHNSMVSLVNL